MAQQLQSVNLIAPGFKGLNTEDSPLGQEASFSSVADNCIIDRYGRVAARNGNEVITETKTELGTANVEVIHEFRDAAGNTVVFSAGNNKILSGTTTLVDETPATYSITSNEWDVVNFNDNAYFFQRGYEPLVYSDSLGAVTKMSDVAGYGVNPARTDMDGNTVLAAFGRLWVADFTDDKSTIYWSDLLQGHVWNGGSSGSIDISKVWPDGYDEIVALASHNNFLIIFGKSSIVIYEGADSPATMALHDTISGVGCYSRDSVVDIGTDILFLSYEGLKNFGRVLQEKSLPLGDLSRNIKQDLLFLLDNETGNVKSAYSPENNLYLLVLPSNDIILAFDLRGTLQNGAYRVTRWPGTGWTAFFRDEDGTLYIGNSDGIGTYSGYQDNGNSYVMKYYSQHLTFGDATRLKFVKKLQPVVIGGSGVVAQFKWGYDFSGAFETAVVTFKSYNPAYYGVAEFGLGEFTPGIVFDRRSFNTNGSGTNIVVGMEAVIDGNALSLQEMNVLTLIGKLV